MNLPGDNAARDIIDARQGIICNWWRDKKSISPSSIRDKLTQTNLDLHVNHFTSIDPTGRPFNEVSPFISLSCGTVERDAFAQTNFIHRALRTALWFGTNFGRSSTAYVYTCWVVLAPRPCIDIETVAEEVRDLNSYRRYFPYQAEGEVVAKIIIPDNQIQKCVKWKWDEVVGEVGKDWTYLNPRFTSPGQLSNVRGVV